jgi:hypothetical protein
METDKRRNLAPLLFVSAVAIGIVPWLHPTNTCHDWLQKWGEQSMHHGWVAMHMLAMAGFAAVAAVGIFLPLLGKRSAVELFGGAGFASGFLIHANTSISHSTQVSWLGRAFNASTNPETRQILRITAESLLRYDDACWRVASVLVTGGGILMMYALYREGVLSRLVAAVTMLLASVWSLQSLGIINRIFGGPIPEIYHFLFPAAWFIVLGVALIRAPAKTSVSSSEPIFGDTAPVAD